ncbi:5-methylcytosine restriction system specificity protein McrC [Corallococcus macrosporus]
MFPGARAGAVPLRSAQTGQVAAGLVVQPRFGWSGVGAVLAQVGWAAAPQFVDLPLVPGSGREIPPWVLAGPVLARLDALLRERRRGFHDVDAVLGKPRGRILWPRYRTESLATGRWHQLPCRYPELDGDPRLWGLIRWTVERVRTALTASLGIDPTARRLYALAEQLLEQVAGVRPVVPTREELRGVYGRGGFSSDVLRQGVEAIGWISDERGLGGGRELDGLAWYLPLAEAWERYVEAVLREEAALTGADLRTARLRQTMFPITWSHSGPQSLSHLAPDFVLRRGRTVQIVDAKYKAHLAELDEGGWLEFTSDAREAHRADVHQVLAYAALFDADEVTVTLVYPLRQETWQVLQERGRETSRAVLTYGGRMLRLELRGLPFGRP